MQGNGYILEDEVLLEQITKLETQNVEGNPQARRA